MSINVYPVPIQTVSVEGTAETTDRAVEQVLEDLKQELKIMNLYNQIVTDEKLSERDIT